MAADQDARVYCNICKKGLRKMFNFYNSAILVQFMLDHKKETGHDSFGVEIAE